MQHLNRFLQILGTIATLASFGSVLVARQYYLAGGLLVVALFSAAVYVYRTRIRPVSYGRLWFSLAFEDMEGKTALFSKRYELKANQGHVTQLLDQNLSADGRLEEWRSSLSDNVSAVREGGTVRLYTFLDYPLPVGGTVVNEISGVVVDSFFAERESFSALVDRGYEEVNLAVTFHRDRLPRTVRAIVVQDGVAQVRDRSVDLVGEEASWSIRKPRIGEKYILEWDW